MPGARRLSNNLQRIISDTGISFELLARNLERSSDISTRTLRDLANGREAGSFQAWMLILDLINSETAATSYRRYSLQDLLGETYDQYSELWDSERNRRLEDSSIALVPERQTAHATNNLGVTLTTLGFSQRALSKISGVSTTTLSNLINKRNSGMYRTWYRIVQGLNILTANKGLREFTLESMIGDRNQISGKFGVETSKSAHKQLPRTTVVIEQLPPEEIQSITPFEVLVPSERRINQVVPTEETRDKAFNELRARLKGLKGAEGWVERVCSYPITLSTQFSGAKTAVGFLDRNFTETNNTVEITLTCLSYIRPATNNIALLAIYPSGAVRSMNASITNVSREFHAVIEDPFFLMDPDDEQPTRNIPTFSAEVVLFAATVGKTNA